MRAMPSVLVVVAALVLAGLAVPAAAQTPVTNADLVRLQENIESVKADLDGLRARDARLAGEIETELENLRDEVSYLKVKLRREGNVTRGEFLELLDKIDMLRGRARGDQRQAPPAAGEIPTPPAVPSIPTPPAIPAPPAGPTPPSQPQGRPGEVPVGTELDVRLQSALSSATAKVEDRFEATTMVDLYESSRVLIPAGSALRGVVVTVDKATRLDRKGSLSLSFDQITIRGRSYPMRATVTQALESAGMKGEVGRIGTGAGVGAIIGGILGGFKGALAGILIGAGGTIAATPGKDVELPPGTVLRLRFDAPLTPR